LDTIENLRPICHKCNKSMTTRNMYEYAVTHYPTALVLKAQENYSPLDINDPEIQEVVEYTFNMLKRIHQSAKLIKTLYAASARVDTGVKFCVNLEITFEDKPRKVEATILRSLFGSYEISSQSIGQLGSIYKKISTEDAGAKNAANIAIELLDKILNGLKFSQIISVEVQGEVTCMKYHIIFGVSNTSNQYSMRDVVIINSENNFEVESYHKLDSIPTTSVVADANDVNVIAAVKFAVDSLNLLHDKPKKLVLRKVVSAQIIEGINYQLILDFSTRSVTLPNFVVVVAKYNNNFVLSNYHTTN